MGIEATRIAISEFPDDPQLHAERGFALYYAVNDSTKAIAEFRKAIALDENLAAAYAGIGEIMVAEENYEDAIYWYNLAIDRNFGNRSWYLARAEAAFAQGNLAQAVSLFEETIRLWPDLVHAYYRIALVYRQAEQPENAVIAIEKAISLADEPKPQYFFRAATIYEWIEENSKALRAYQQVLTLEPSNDLAKRGVERLNNISD
jgi:tetratricopeptide (TPR) repeat protein